MPKSLLLFISLLVLQTKWTHRINICGDADITIIMSIDDREIKKQLSESDEEVTDKISEEGGDAEAIKRGIEAKKERDSTETGKKVAKDLGDAVETGDNATNPT